MTGQFMVDQEVLIKLLAAIQPICSRRTTVDTTSTIMFQVGNKELMLKSTDLEISLQASCNITESTCNELLSFLVPGKRVFDLVKELDGNIMCVIDNHRLSFKSGAAYVELNIKDSEGFPPFPERIENLTQLDSAYLMELLDKVSFLIPQNNANPSLNGLFIEFGPKGLMLTTTDGHCLAQIVTQKYHLEEDRQWLLPRRAVFELKKIIEYGNSTTIFLGICGNQLVFSGDSFNFFSKLLNDQFPQYRPIMQKEGFVPARLDKDSFMRTLRRSSCLLSGQFLATKFAFDKENLQVSLENKEVGTLHEELPVYSFGGSPLNIRFYAPYLINGLQSFEDSEITCYLHNSSKPIIFQTEKNDYNLTYLVMPVSPTA